jgi:N-acetylglucosamine-6-phosphate deacetylase
MTDSGDAFAISTPRVFDGEQFLSDYCVIIRQGVVAQLLPSSACPADLTTIELETGVLAPGFIDLQVNGGGDLLFNNAPTQATLDIMLGAHRCRGTTAIVPTLLSDTREQQERAVAVVRSAMATGTGGILGIHLEGPFFEPARRGAHSASMLRRPSEEDIDWLASLRDLRVIVTLAPEQCEPGQIERLADSGIILCAGHTEARWEQIDDAAAHGLQGVTHLYNAMSTLSARAPGAVGAALADDRLWAGIIADGHHIHPVNIRLAHRAKPPGRLVLVSDAMATVGGELGEFALYGETIRESAGRLVNADGALAGSAIGLIDAVRYCVETVGLELAECLRMASYYPAAILGLEDRLGRIAPGYRADLVHFLDQTYSVHNTWVGGRRSRHREQ